MAILVDRETRVLIQGITGRSGTPVTSELLDYGVKVVSGVTPGKGGQEVDTVPVFNSVKEAIEEVAGFTGLTVNDVWAVASFYPNFRFQPPCQHQLELCWGPSCHLMGAMSVIGAALEQLGVEGEGDLADGSLTLRYNTCLGACAQAPVISADHSLMGRQTVESVKTAIVELLSQPARHQQNDG